MFNRRLHARAAAPRPSSRFLVRLVAVAILAQPFSAAFAADDTIPKGFTPDRYASLWERNPFTLVTPVAAQAHSSAFDKMALVSWSQDGDHEVVFVQNTDTNDVQKVSASPNAQGLRLVEVHRNANLQAVEAILANGTEQGPVRFRTEAPAAALAGAGAGPGVGVTGDPTGQGAPAMAAPVPVPQPPMPNGSAFNAGPVNQRMNSNLPRPNNQPNVPRVPTAADYRRRRVLPTPNINLQTPVNPQAPVGPTRENQD